MKARLVLLVALALATLGMAIVILAITSPGMFFVGIYLIDAALMALAVAGVLCLLPNRNPT